MPVICGPTAKMHTCLWKMQRSMSAQPTKNDNSDIYHPNILRSINVQRRLFISAMHGQKSAGPLSNKGDWIGTTFSASHNYLNIYQVCMTHCLNALWSKPAVMLLSGCTRLQPTEKTGPIFTDSEGEAIATDHCLQPGDSYVAISGYGWIEAGPSPLPTAGAQPSLVQFLSNRFKSPPPWPWYRPRVRAQKYFCSAQDVQV